MDRERFLEIRGRYLNATRPIQSEEHLKGRDRALARLDDALQTPGRHAFIYGLRGVGKSSLAQTLAFKLQLSSKPPILVGCDPSSTFKSVSIDIVEKLLAEPLRAPTPRKIGGGLSIAGTGVSGSYETGVRNQGINIVGANDTLKFLDAAVRATKQPQIIVIDEFDQISPTEHQLFATLIKQISDQRIDAKIIFSGIAETIDKLFSAHKSIFRQIHSEKIDRLDLQSCLDIIDDASEHLEIKIKDDFRFRIAQISDGFPSFVHLLAEKIFTSAFDQEQKTVSRTSYEEGLDAAIESVEFSLKSAYETLLHRHTRKYEHVIWAISNDRLLDVNVDDVWRHYDHICNQIGEIPTTRANLNTKLNQLTSERYQHILLKPRRSNYTFSEKMMRAYARLRAERAGCALGVENPGLT